MGLINYCKVNNKQICTAVNYLENIPLFCIEYNKAFSINDWSDFVLIELGKIWNRTEFELVDLSSSEILIPVGDFNVSVQGIFNPLLEYQIYNDELYARCSEKLKKHILKDKLLYAKFKELNPDIESKIDIANKNKIERAKVTPQLREAIFRRDNYTCKICGKVKGKDDLFEIDHIIPIAKGGRTEVDNLQTLCWKCNRDKGTKLL